jgi:hypothetical protein
LLTLASDPAVSQLYYLPGFYTRVAHSAPGLQQGKQSPSHANVTRHVLNIQTPAITAAGLAGYAKGTRQKDLNDAATRHYVAAIRGINAAIADPKTAIHNSTLMSVIMAAMFEVLIVPRLSGMENCAKHLDGAVAIGLLKLKQEDLTEETHKLLTTLVHSVIISKWQQDGR